MLSYRLALARQNEEPTMSAMKLLQYQPISDLLAPPVVGGAPLTISLCEPAPDSGVPLMTALARRRSTREFADTALSERQLGELLWAADGVNRHASGGRTAPSARHVNEIDIYAALPNGIYRYDAGQHLLVLKRPVDARNSTGYQDFVALAPLDLVYVVNYSRLLDIPKEQQAIFSAAAAGAIAQNVYLYCASAGLVTVVRAWLNHRHLAEIFGLNEDEVPVLAQTVGLPLVQGPV
jgi:SagB-type dehydrogenase family enzyme